MRVKEIRERGYPQIADLAILRAGEQKNACGEKSDIGNESVLKWNKTPEGENFWSLINSGFFGKALELYPVYFDIYYAKTPEQLFIESMDDMDKKLKQLETRYHDSLPRNSQPDTN